MATRLSSAGWLLLCLAQLASGGTAGRFRCSVTAVPGDDLQHVLDRILADGRPARICLGSGEFRLPRFLSLDRDDVVLRGEGASTVLRVDAGTESPVVVVGDYRHATPHRIVSHVTIERLRIVGGGRGGSEVDHDHPYMTNSALVVRAGRHVAIRDLDVTACRSACILTERGSRDVTIERNRVGGSVWDGISLNRTARARLVGNVVRGNTAAGITAEHLEDSLVADNVVRDNATHGLYLADSYRNTITGNRFTDNVLSGVFLTCAVRDRGPVVRCWKDSMSQQNVFERNALVGNRVGYTAAADRAANCTAPRFVPNRSRGDLFSRNLRAESDRRRYGRCLVFVGRSP